MFIYLHSFPCPACYSLQEIAEVLKIQKIDRLRYIHASLSSIYLGTEPLDDPASLGKTSMKIKRKYLKEKSTVIYFNGRYIAKPPDVTKDGIPIVLVEQDQDLADLRNQDISYVLRDYTQTTRRVVGSAMSLRAPGMSRDSTLVNNGFLKKARREFLNLREMCMTKAQLEKRAAHEAKMKQKEKLHAAKLKKKHAAELRNQKKLHVVRSYKGLKDFDAAVGDQNHNDDESVVSEVIFDLPTSYHEECVSTLSPPCHINIL